MVDQPLNVSTYKNAGVDIDNSNTFIDFLKTRVKINTGFAATLDMPFGPTIVLSADGVGTKAQLALQFNEALNNEPLKWIGMDLVAAVFNDVITTGAAPWYMLDYYGVNKLNVEHASLIIEGIIQGLECCDAALVGGETAEMTDTYQENAFDLVGFGVGYVDRDKVIDSSNIETGDIIIGVDSSGPHANGYTLIRKILKQKNFIHIQNSEDDHIIRSLLTPAYIYWGMVETLRTTEIKAMANITGGGILENIPRALPNGYRAVLEVKSWDWPEIFSWIQRTGNVPMDEMYRVFNCGIGYVVIVSEENVDDAITSIKNSGHQCQVIGCVVPCRTDENRCIVT